MVGLVFTFKSIQFNLFFNISWFYFQLITVEKRYLLFSYIHIEYLQ